MKLRHNHHSVSDLFFSEKKNRPIFYISIVGNTVRQCLNTMCFVELLVRIAHKLLSMLLEYVCVPYGISTKFTVFRYMGFM